MNQFLLALLELPEVLYLLFITFGGLNFRMINENSLAHFLLVVDL